MSYRHKHICALPAIIGISIGIALAFMPVISRLIATT
jgi:hypothetical protein